MSAIPRKRTTLYRDQPVRFLPTAAVSTPFLTRRLNVRFPTRLAPHALTPELVTERLGCGPYVRKTDYCDENPERAHTIQTKFRVGTFVQLFASLFDWFNRGIGGKSRCLKNPTSFWCMEPGATLHIGGMSFLSCMKRDTGSSECKIL
jgi:hypothetical protein